MEMGVYPMPDFNAPSAHETLILQNMLLMLTGRFVGKIMTYIKPAPGASHEVIYMTLITDVLKVASMSMEMSKPAPDAPKEFSVCYDNAVQRIIELVQNGLTPEAEAEYVANMSLLSQCCVAADIKDIILRTFTNPPQ